MPPVDRDNPVHSTVSGWQYSLTKFMREVVGSARANTIQGFFGHLKPSVRETYRKVSHKWLQAYLHEYISRDNERASEQAMLKTLLPKTAK